MSFNKNSENKEKKKDITFRDQMKKFAIKNVVGFQTVLLYGLGTRLGIFAYLDEKCKQSNKIPPVIFTLEELVQEVGLSNRYLDAWLHMALECGIFEVENPIKQSLKTAPFIYELLIDQTNIFYVGGMLVTVSLQSQIIEELLKNFKTGKTATYLDINPEGYQAAQMGTIGQSKQILKLFSRKCRELHKRLKKEGSILEVGCGYGNNLETWARKYKNSRIVGIDIDPNGIKFTNNLVLENNWNDRIEIIETPIHSFVPSKENFFDLIMLHQVLHEMNPDDSFRIKIFEDLYKMLKDDGILIVVEPMVPEMYEEKPNHIVFFEIWHKFLEIMYDSKFYSKKSFQEFVKSTPFKKTELIQEGSNYLWAISK